MGNHLLHARVIFHKDSFLIAWGQEVGSFTLKLPSWIHIGGSSKLSPNISSLLSPVLTASVQLRVEVVQAQRGGVSEGLVRTYTAGFNNIPAQ